LTTFGTGEGQTTPPGINGKLADSPSPTPVLPVELFIGDVRAEIQYVGGVSGQVVGLLKIDVRLPDAIPIGQQSIILKVGDALSQRGVFINVA